MITKETFEHFKTIKAKSGEIISHENILPVRDKLSMADASNYHIEDNDGESFWNFIDELYKSSIIFNLGYVLEDLFTEAEYGENDEELYEDSEDTYLKYIIFESDLSGDKVEEKISTILADKFGAICFKNPDFGDQKWCITWD